MRTTDLPEIVRSVPTSKPQKIIPNHVVKVWERWLLVKKPRVVADRSFPEPDLIEVPARKLTYVEQVPHPPKWGEKYRMKPGPKSERPKWCPLKTWATAQKRKQRGAKITTSMLREIMAAQAAKAARRAQ